MTGDQSAQTAHLPEHGTPLHGVGPNGAAINGRGGRLQPRDADSDADQNRNRNTGPQDLPEHGPPLHSVGPNGAAINGRGGRLQPRDADSDADQNRNRNTGPQDLPAALLTLQFRTGDIHYTFVSATGEPFPVSVSWCVLSGLSWSCVLWVRGCVPTRIVMSSFGQYNINPSSPANRR